MRNAVLFFILIAAGSSHPRVIDRIQPVFMCWESDMEFPVDCGDEDGD